MDSPKTDLPEARIIRNPRWYLKDGEFLSEIGGALACLGLLLMTLVLTQRFNEDAPSDAFSANVLAIMLLVTYGLTCSFCIMAHIRLMTAGGRQVTFLHRFAVVLMTYAVVTASVGVIAIGVVRLILPLQAFFAWLTASTGLSLIIRMRQKARAAKRDAA